MKAPEPEPEVEKIPCDKCGHPMLPTETKCPKCGAEYEVDGEPEKPAPKAAAPASTRVDSKPSAASAPAAEPTSSKVKKPGGPKKAKPEPQVEQGGERDTEGEPAAEMPAKCWACNSKNIGKNEKGAIACLDCGVEQSDEVPFS